MNSPSKSPHDVRETIPEPREGHNYNPYRLPIGLLYAVRVVLQPSGITLLFKRGR